MKKDISEMTKSELIAHIDNQIKLIKEQDSESKIVMTQEEFRLALIDVEKMICPKNSLFSWETDRDNCIINAFYEGIRIAYNDGYPVIMNKGESMYLREFMDK